MEQYRGWCELLDDGRLVEPAPILYPPPLLPKVMLPDDDLRKLAHLVARLAPPGSLGAMLGLFCSELARVVSVT